MAGTGWLLFFYSVPTKPSSNRLKVWRRLIKAGAAQIKGAVYALPDNEEHYELFQWLVSEVAVMKGEAAFVRVPRIETMTDGELIALFNRQREEDYRPIEEGLGELGRKTDAVRKSSGTMDFTILSDQLAKLMRGFEEVSKTDFFSSAAGKAIIKRIKAIEADIAGIAAAGVNTREAALTPRRIEDYQGKVWVTRKRPFIDRMACAWLIRKFIDQKAMFEFIDEGGGEAPGMDLVSFDMRGAEFTHVGELCTFEAMAKSFGLKDKGLAAVAEIVHELDVKDDRYKRAEARGVEEILSGVRKTARDDAEALEKGMSVFEMLYASKR
jgi:hypothetical protein